MVAAMEVPPSQAQSYGILDVDPHVGPIAPIKGMVEKPAPGTQPSNLAVIGRYILTPDVLCNLASVGYGAAGEIQLTDAIAQEITQGRAVSGFRFDGKRFDCGSKSGYLQATIELALARDDLRDDLIVFLENLTHIKQAAQ